MIYFCYNYHHTSFKSFAKCQADWWYKIHIYLLNYNNNDYLSCIRQK